jgi:UDP-N-acetylmuramoyl-L-alanyl-D-glutamate--2,6-diaminopimelate ligase
MAAILMCVCTNLGWDHVDYHGSEEAYVVAKARLCGDFSARWHVFNLDDPYRQALVRTSRARLLTYGIQSAATLQPLALQLDIDGIRFILPTTKGRMNRRKLLVRPVFIL